jgi:wyosine [tRNA(Phe)-imidazoG37] synthetase (radical SAM superfamily)
MYKYIFGPVPSRRLGMSLGVDLVPHKICSLDCVYCECGSTTKLTTNRKEYILYDNITKELTHYFANNPDPDYITFSGSGEPTLNSRIGDVLAFIKEKKPNVPTAVITNGTLLSEKQVRSELLDADIVLPSLDAAIDLSFQKINRPCHNLDINEYIEGLYNFRNEFKGKIWLEVLIIPDYNDMKENLISLKKAILKIRPDLVQLNALDRPGIVDDIRTATQSELKKIVDFWKLDNVEIIAAAINRKSILSYRKDIETAILETIFRRPCTVNDLAQIIGSNTKEVNKYLDVLEAEGRVEVNRQKRGLFYQRKNG